MNDPKTKLRRREFLLTLGAGGAATAAVLASPLARQAGTPAATAEPRSSIGYRASEHVRNYYRTAKV
ncbi:MAG: hypothetical protein OEW21_18935 [Betaproteobacteria bacterium]|nr:hypothetical protein [Betaproteobacteria bacterium]